MVKGEVLFIIQRRYIIRLNCDFIITPRILFSDKNLTRTDIDLLSLIISLTLKSNYCYASNKYLAEYINISIRTISDSLSRLRRLGYIKVRYENNNRRIYLNTEKIPTKVATEVEENCSKGVATDCEQNINREYKREYNKTKNFKKQGIVPYWLEHPEVCKSEPLNEEEQKELDELLKEIQENISHIN